MLGPASLRQRLLLWLMGPALLLAVGLMVKNYIDIRETADTIQDRLLVALAVSISEHALNAPGDLLGRDVAALIEEFTNEDTFYFVRGPDGAYVSGYTDMPRPTGTPGYNQGGPQFYNATYQGEWVRGVTLTYLVAAPLPGWMSVSVTQTRRERDALVRSTVMGSAMDMAIVVCFAAGFVWIGVGRALAPLHRLQAAIRRRSQEDLRPITHRMPAEVADVVNALNVLLARLKNSLHANQRFIAEASHQLRTPLAALQTDLEWAVRDAPSTEDQAKLTRILESARRLSRLAGQLLNLARVGPEAREAGGHQQVDLAELAAEVTREMVGRALAQDMDLGYEGPLRGIVVSGSAVMLREMLVNLIDNALTHCPSGASVTVHLRAGGSGVGLGPVLEVEDDGPGIPEAERQRVLGRFVSLNGRDGCGLGLAIVDEVAQAHGTCLTLDEGQGGRGLLVRVAFPGDDPVKVL